MYKLNRLAGVLVLWLLGTGCASLEEFWSSARARGDKRKLERFAKVLTGKLPAPGGFGSRWERRIKACGQICKRGAYHFDDKQKPVFLTGSFLSDYLEALKRIDESTSTCLENIHLVGSKPGLKKVMKCLDSINYRTGRPVGVHPFYLDAKEFYSRESAVAQVEARLKALAKIEAKAAIDFADIEKQNRLMRQRLAKQDREDKKASGGLRAIPAAERVMRSKIGSRFRMAVFHEYIFNVNYAGNKQRFTYMVADPEVMKSNPTGGYGNYFIRCSVKICNENLKYVQGNEFYGERFVVRYSGKTNLVNAFGQRLVMPILEVIRSY